MLKLGQFLGPSIDVGQAITAMILTQFGQVLTPDEREDKDGTDIQEQFMAKVHEKLGS